MTWGNFNKLEYCIPHVEFGTVTENDLLFKRVINYKTGMKIILIIINHQQFDFLQALAPFELSQAPTYVFLQLLNSF